MERKPDFDNILAVLKKEKPSRPTLFEFFMNGPIYSYLAGREPKEDDQFDEFLVRVKAFEAAGYDYATVNARFGFKHSELTHKDTLSLNEAHSIETRADFNNYPWPDPEKADFSVYEKIVPYLPGNMKIMQNGPGGVLENVTRLLGYDNMCLMTYDDPDLLADVFDAVGSRLLRYYERGMEYDCVGILMSNDDWGFNTQTFLSTELMRKYVFPWHKKFVAAAHAKGKPAVLHSCGNLSAVMDDIIDDMKFDGKHSYEDVICPVEDMYEKYCGRVAILGGIDVNFICTRPPEDTFKRAKAMLERAESRGGYALGTGNSVPEYVPWDAYFALISAATGKKYN